VKSNLSRSPRIEIFWYPALIIIQDKRKERR
jgi:hypothetical protein